jgi:hypothetical protein
MSNTIDSRIVRILKAAVMREVRLPAAVFFLTFLVPAPRFRGQQKLLKHLKILFYTLVPHLFGSPRIKVSIAQYRPDVEHAYIASSACRPTNHVQSYT